MSVNPDSIPRYEQPMDPAPERRCGDCGHYEDVLCAHNGMGGLVGVCCVERDLGRDTRIDNVDPMALACDEWVAA